jgi:C4-type Zn-finger protein
MSVQEIQERLRGISCPICKQSAFTMNPRADPDFGISIHKARCNNCAYLFPVHIPNRPMSEIDPDVDQWLRGLSCPSCQEPGVVMEFRCTPSVRESIYFVSCKACHQPFAEKAPMEAYE